MTGPISKWSEQKDKNGLISDCPPVHSLKHPGISLARRMARGVRSSTSGRLDEPAGTGNAFPYKHWESKFLFFLLLRNHKISSLIS